MTHVHTQGADTSMFSAGSMHEYSVADAGNGCENPEIGCSFSSLRVEMIYCGSGLNN